MPVSVEQLEAQLKDLARVGTRIECDDLRELWQFEHAGKIYHVHFYPRSDFFWRRMIRGNGALAEFTRLQWLQKASIPSPRAGTVMMGFWLDGRPGNALITEAIAPSTRLDHLLFQHDLDGTRVPQRHQLLTQLLGILREMARAGLGHSQLQMRRFSVRAGTLYLTDARGICRGGLHLTQLFRLAHSARTYLTRTDIVRAWDAIGPDRATPVRNTLSKQLWRRFIRTVRRNSEHFGRLNGQGWSGVFTRCAPRPVRWANASRLIVERAEWERVWPLLLERINSDQLDYLKRGDSGDVVTGEIVLDGKPISIVVKRPRRKFWWRYLTEIGRGSRARRTWVKTWKMLIRDIPCEWPLLMMERRVLGYPVESLLVFQFVPGPTLADVDLDALDPDARRDLLYRTGHLLRRIDELGFMHADAKSTNWIVFDDPVRGPSPILIDADGVRHYRWAMMGLERLLRAMKQHSQYTPADSMDLCRGYAPDAKLARDVDPDEAEDVSG